MSLEPKPDPTVYYCTVQIEVHHGLPEIVRSWTALSIALWPETSAMISALSSLVKLLDSLGMSLDCAWGWRWGLQNKVDDIDYLLSISEVELVVVHISNSHCGYHTMSHTCTWFCMLPHTFSASIWQQKLIMVTHAWTKIQEYPQKCNLMASLQL